MKQIIGVLLFSAILSGAFFSCKKDENPSPDMGYNYFPDKVGSYTVYNVDSFYYDDFSSPVTIDTFKFQLKEKIQSSYPDNQNRTTLRLERYIRNYNPAIPYSSLPWILKDVWAANRTTTTAEKVEENVRYVKLAFPVKEGQTWNGNAQNTNPEWDYTYQFFDQKRTIGGITFDSVLQVNQIVYQDLIQQRHYIEKYARNVGLVYKQVIDVESQPPNLSLIPLEFQDDTLDSFYAKPILQRIDSGVIYSYTISSFGTE
jgi:hypothetical protein